MMWYVTIIGLVLILCSITAFILIRKKHIKFLINNSIALKELETINNKYNFCTNIRNFDESYVYDNENYYENISCEDYLIYQLQYKKYDVAKEIRKIDYNKAKYESYCKEISGLEKFGKYITTTDNLNKKYLLALEKKFFREKQLKPKIDFSIQIILRCSKINGVVYKNKYQKFSSEQIALLIKRLNNKNRNFYNDNEIWHALCRVERGRVSNKMRFSIYQRDGYRCRICGRSNRYGDLEIDHIKPISKGGKSTFDNLQTLCSRCNKIKGNTY